MLTQTELERSKRENTKFYERRGLNRHQAANYIGISVSMLDELVKAGEMPKPIRIRSRVLWDVRALDAAFDDLGDLAENPWDDVRH